MHNKKRNVLSFLSERPAGPTVLQTRTQEERDRITTVRIAEVLMGDERVTQVMQHNEEKISQVDENIDLKSRLLRSYHRVVSIAFGE